MSSALHGSARLYAHVIKLSLRHTIDPLTRMVEVIPIWLCYNLMEKEAIIKECERLTLTVSYVRVLEKLLVNLENKLITM